jgi:monoamine oxidase
MAEDILDVAVIGGGVSGVYTAWRLLTEGDKRKVAVFEASSEVGGRLLSVVPPEIPFMTAELGGMRILPAVQPRINALLYYLNKTAPPGGKIEMYDFPVDEPENISYLRGIYLRLKDFTEEPEKVPYDLSFQEFGKTATQIVLYALDQIVPGVTDKGLTEEQRQEMCRNAEFAGKPLWQQGFWQVLLRVISGEGYQLALAAGGYDTTLSNWNAADAIPWYLSDFGVSAKYQGFQKGFQQVPLTVQQRFEHAKPKGNVYCNAPATGFVWDAKNKLVEISFKHQASVRAKALILAMPRRALEIIKPNSPVLEAASGLIASVTPRPLFKLFTTYLSPWWIPAGVKSGRTTTDLPVRQTYYWPTDKGAAVTDGRAMLMASYDDGNNIGYWDGYRRKRGIGWREIKQTIIEPEYFVGAADRQAAADAENAELSRRWRDYRAPDDMVEEVSRQVQLIHGLSFSPKVQNAAFRDWGDDPFGGGWNSWNIGVQSNKVKEKIIQPDAGLPVYICGEAYSDAQGWVEGALQTADMVLAKFGLKPLPPPPPPPKPKPKAK